MNWFKFKGKSVGNQLKSTIVDSGDDNSSVVTLIKEFVAGDVFLKETVQKQYLYVLLIFVLSLVYINNRFLYERELREVNMLKNEVVDVRYRALTISKEVKQAGRRTMIIDELKQRGSSLEEATAPIVIIEK